VTFNIVSCVKSFVTLLSSTSGVCLSLSTKKLDHYSNSIRHLLYPRLRRANIPPSWRRSKQGSSSRTASTTSRWFSNPRSTRLLLHQRRRLPRLLLQRQSHASPALRLHQCQHADLRPLTVKHHRPNLPPSRQLQRPKHSPERRSPCQSNFCIVGWPARNLRRFN
jgi:hypothetical protein